MMSPLPLLSLLVPLVTSLPAPSPFLLDPLPSLQEILTRPSGRPLTITVEGNVGAGKSTLLNYFKQHSQVMRVIMTVNCQICIYVTIMKELVSQADIFLEPLEIWQNLNGTNFLDLTYSDAKRCCQYIL